MPHILGSPFRSPLTWAAIAVGTGLRSVGLFQQVLVGDEMHAYRFAPEVAFPEVLFAYSSTANSPPFNAWLRLLLDLGIPPSELALRIPVLASGIAMLIVAPWWIGRRFGNRTATIAAWLLALSPPLVLYSRVMRPYMPMALLSAAAAGAFYSWWCTRRRSAGVAYALLAAAAVYFNLLAAPFVLAPFAFLALEAGLRGRSVLPARADLTIVAGLLAGSLALLVIPAWTDLIFLTTSNRVPLSLDVVDGRILALALHLCGTGVLALALIVWGTVAAGGVRLARLDSALLRYVLVICATELVVVPLLTLKFINYPPVIARYLIALVTPILFLASLGLARVERGRRLAIPFLLAALLFTGPLSDPDLYRNPFALKRDLFTYHRRPPSFRYRPPDAYDILSAGPRGAIVEYPFPPSDRLLRPLADYWNVHQRPTRIAPGRPPLGDPRLGLRSILSDEPGRLLDSDAVFLVVHLDWESEIGPSLLPPARVLRGRGLARQNLERMRHQAARMKSDLERTWGPPDAGDAQVAIWNLARVRAEATRREEER